MLCGQVLGHQGRQFFMQACRKELAAATERRDGAQGASFKAQIRG